MNSHQTNQEDRELDTAIQLHQRNIRLQSTQSETEIKSMTYQYVREMKDRIGFLKASGSTRDYSSFLASLNQLTAHPIFKVDCLVSSREWKYPTREDAAQ